MLTLYGIRNCDTVKRARVWLDGQGVAYRFHDYKTAGVEAERLADWVDRLGWERVLNRTGTTVRKLPEAEKTGLDAARATALMLAHPSAIRRPMIEGDGVLIAGFDPASFQQTFLPA